MSESFGARLVAKVAAAGPLVAGIDPHPGLLSDWGLPLDASGLERLDRKSTRLNSSHRP